MKHVYAFAIGVMTYLGISAIEYEGLQSHGGHKIYFWNSISSLCLHNVLYSLWYSRHFNPCDRKHIQRAAKLRVYDLAMEKLFLS